MRPREATSHPRRLARAFGTVVARGTGQLAACVAQAVVPNEGTLVTQHDATVTQPIVTSPYVVNRVA